MRLTRPERDLRLRARLIRVENAEIIGLPPNLAMRVLQSLLSVLLITSPLPSTGYAQPPAGASQIKHVIFILKENHTFDNYFGAFPGANGTSSGKIHTGATVLLTRAPDVSPGDISHSWNAALLGMDGGKMDGFDLLKGARQDGILYSYTQYQSDQLPNYFAYAHQFALADKFFTSVHGPSFPNHLYTVAGQAGGAMNNPIFSRQGFTGVWGCDAPSVARVAVLQNGEKSYVYPCFDFKTLADSMNTAGLSWKYYGVSKGTPGYVWSPFDAIRHIRFGPQWSTNVVDDEQYADDAATNNLATVSWITTDLDESEHPGRDQEPCVGENSTVAFINAVMQSPAWNSTVIFVSWDDFGGFYDHVRPPQIDAWGLGPRVGLLIISPFAKSGYIEHTPLEFSSIVKFVEQLYGLPFLTARDGNSADMWDAFNFAGAPQAPLPLQPQTCP